MSSINRLTPVVSEIVGLLKFTAIVSAISHYDEEKLEQLNELAKETALLWSPNITIGVNFLIIASRVLKEIAPIVTIVCFVYCN